MSRKVYYPVTPGDTVCTWLESDSEDEAWEKLMKDASHMPYPDKSAFEIRGYSVESIIMDDVEDE